MFSAVSAITFGTKTMSVCHVGDRFLRQDTDTGDELQASRFGRHQARLEQSSPRVLLLERVPEPARRPQRVVDAIDDRRIAFAKYRQAHADRLGGHGSGAHGSIGSMLAILPLTRARRQS
jgi:hypothetical protein